MIQYEWLGVLLRRSGSPGDHGFSDPVTDHKSDVLVADCESVRQQIMIRLVIQWRVADLAPQQDEIRD